MTTVLTTIVVINNGKVGLTDAEIGGFTYQKGLFLMLLARNNGIVVVRLPPSPPKPVDLVFTGFLLPVFRWSPINGVSNIA